LGVILVVIFLFYEINQVWNIFLNWVQTGFFEQVEFNYQNEQNRQNEPNRQNPRRYPIRERSVLFYILKSERLSLMLCIL